MEFDRYFVVLLRKGPTWSPETTPEVEQTQQAHLAHLARLSQSGKLAVAGPVQLHEDGDIRGISVFRSDEVSSYDAVRALVEEDPAFKAGRLVAEYMTWHVPRGANLNSG